MDPHALLLARLQFGFTISFHIIFPAFSIGYPPTSPRFWCCGSAPAATTSTGSRASGRRSSRFPSPWAWSPASRFRMSSAPTGAASPRRRQRHRTADRLRSADGLFPRGNLPWRDAFRLEARPAVAARDLGRPGRAGTVISGFWILAANSWMQTPAGYELQMALPSRSTGSGDFQSELPLPLRPHDDGRLSDDVGRGAGGRRAIPPRRASFRRKRAP